MGRSWAISDTEVPRVSERFENARSTAVQATARLREKRTANSGVFSPMPSEARRKHARRLRRAASIRSALYEWEVAASFRPLAASDLQHALWLLAWLESPPRRLEALRWYLGLRDRDIKGSELLLAELKSDADTAQLAEYLENGRDYLRLLPDVSDHVITDEELQGISDEDLRWLHLAQWAAQGGYRFADPVVAAYFAQFPWYAPLPEGSWRKQCAQDWMKNPDVPLLRMNRPAIPSGAPKESLEAILRAERVRHLEPPAL